MIDQAHALRTLVEQQRSGAVLPTHSDRYQTTRVLGVTSAKGGVGKTTLALELGKAIARTDRKVCVWDITGNASHDLLSGFHHRWALSQLLTGARTAEEAITTGPEGVDYLLGSGVDNLTTALTSQNQNLNAALRQWEQDYDMIILDLPGACHPDVQAILTACHSIWMICTPEPTAVAATYGWIKSATSLLPQTELVVNQVASPEFAFDVIDRLQQTTKLFLRQTLNAGGFVPSDPTWKAFTEPDSDSPGRETIQTLATQWLREQTCDPALSFTERYPTSIQKSSREDAGVSMRT